MCCNAHKQKMSKDEMAAYRAGIDEVRRLARARFNAALYPPFVPPPSLLTRREIAAANTSLDAWLGEDRVEVPPVLRQAEAVVERVARELVPV